VKAELQLSDCCPITLYKYKATERNSYRQRKLHQVQWKAAPEGVSPKHIKYRRCGNPQRSSSHSNSPKVWNAERQQMRESGPEETLQAESQPLSTNPPHAWTISIGPLPAHLPHGSLDEAC